MNQLQTGIARAARPLGVLALLAIASFTLRSNRALAEFVATTPMYCIICGDGGLSDLILNFLLFLPLGIAMGLALWSPLRAWITAAALSLLIESTQLWILVGRDASLSDVLSNSTGAFAGAVAAAHLLRPPARRSTPGRLVAALSFAASTLGLTGWALLPAQLSPAAWLLTVAPPKAGLARYTGIIDSVRLGRVVLVPALSTVPHDVSSELGRPEWHLVVRGQGGLVMNPEATMLELQGDGQLQFRMDQQWCAFAFLPRRQAATLRLYQAGVWVDAACRESTQELFTIRAAQSSRHLSIHVDSRGHTATTDIPLYLAAGWVHLWPFADYLNPRRPLTEFLWIVLVFVPTGVVMLPSLRARGFAGGAGVVILYLLSVALGLNTPTIAQYLGVPSGMAVGEVGRELYSRLHQRATT